MKRFLPISLISLILFAFCQPVPITGRKQLQLIPQEQLLGLSTESYRQIRDSLPVVTGTPEAEMVERVGNKIQAAIIRYFADKNESDRLNGYQWKYTLFEDSAVNAWAMPGGKVGVYTGILPVTKDETGLAVVMGHEMAHVVAGHGNERMSQILLVQLGGVALQEALSQNPALTQQLALAAFGAGTQIGILLPYSRTHESEADRLGLIFMAMAGYDPRAATPFWQRMAEQEKGILPPQFLSTHPDPSNRMREIKKWTPEALRYYRKD